MEVRIRFGSGIAKLAPAPLLTVDLPGDTTVADLYDRLADSNPELREVLPSSLPVIAGAHVDRAERLAPGDEVALLMPVSGG